ncbi:MAG TPA: right-handed parallel beta-helix repeat-containing protein [Verrucomicrobiae bacterium]
MNTTLGLGRAWMCAALFIFALTRSPATVYEVGDAKPFTAIGQVPWETLAAGDTVLIHWRTNAYQEKWVICRQGAPAAPITIRGVPGANGQLPVIDGNGATTRAQLNFWNQDRAVVKIGGASVPADTTPAHIVVEGLEIRGARPPFTFRNPAGTTAAYVANAAAVYVEKGTNIVIRNCVLHDCGNGLFIAHATRNATIEGNYLHGNGNEGSAYEHNSYTAALGITFQFNRYGPLRANCLGNALKDRSAGLVVHYNWIEGGNRQLDLVDAEDSAELRQSPLYGVTHVYGNVLVEQDDSGNSQIVHYGGDSGTTTAYRKGTLHFYHNTVVSLRGGNTTLFRLSTNDEYCDARNNLFFVTASGNRLALLNSEGRLLLTHNWLKAGYVNSHSGLTGSITNDGSNLTGADPGFLALARQEFRLHTNSACRNAGTNLHPAVLPDHAPVRQYRKHQQSAPRTNLLAPDLGAFAFSPFAAWQQAVFGTNMDNASVASEWADPDGDGVLNLFEYAFQMDALVASRTGLPQALLVGEGTRQYFAIQFPRRPPPSELAYTVEASPDLAQWQAGSWYSDFGSVASNALTCEVPATGVTQVRLLAPVSASQRGFLRVRVEGAWE